jgi:hypothetical protein
MPVRTSALYRCAGACGGRLERPAGYIAVMADTAADRLVIAEISGVTGRHMPLSGPYPHGGAAAIADVRAVARGRADLLAQFAGTALGLSVVELVDQRAAQMVGQASLAARAGADMDLVARWIPVGVKRGEDILASRTPGH